MSARDDRIVGHVAFVAKQGLGQMTEAELSEGWQRLASRLERGEHLEPQFPCVPGFPGASGVWLGGYRRARHRGLSPAARPVR